MKNQVGPWRRTSIAAGEGQAAMLLDSLTLPWVAGDDGRIVAAVLHASALVAQGSITCQIEKDGTIVGVPITLSGSQTVIVQFTTINQPKLIEGTKIRLLLETSSDLSPAGLSLLAWLVVPN